MANKTGLSVLISIILTIIIVSVINVGISLFLSEPKYSDFCNDSKFYYQNNPNITQKLCEDNDGIWHDYSYCNDKYCVDLAEEGYCDFYSKCQGRYDDALKPYNQNRFYILAVIGFVLLLIGLFAIENLIQITGLATGGILVFEGIVMNLENKLIVFISLLLILVIFGVLAYRIIRKNTNKNKSTKSKK